MNRGQLAAALAVAAMVTATPGAAQGKIDRGNGMYFNRAGATLDTMIADTAACQAIAKGADSQINGVEVLAGGLGSILGGAIAGGRLKRVNVENCMLVRGWRLYAMTKQDGAAWKALGETGQRAALTDLVGASSPARGTLLREWRNDYAEPVLWQKN